MKNIIIGLLSIIVIVLIGTNVYSYIQVEKFTPLLSFPTVLFRAKEQPSPYDWITQDQIKVYNDRVILQINDPEWASFTNTNSMDPLIDETSHAIEIVPKSETDIHVGDVVSYESEFADGIIIHRVIEIKEDEQGIYFVFKGDNISQPDPGKVRFSQIKRVLVAIIY